MKEGPASSALNITMNLPEESRLVTWRSGASASSPSFYKDYKYCTLYLRSSSKAACLCSGGESVTDSTLGSIISGVSSDGV